MHNSGDIMEPIKVFVDNQIAGELFKGNTKRKFGFNYLSDEAPISLAMPCRKESYIWENDLHPIFDMYIPEGFLFELMKKHIQKRFGYIDNYLIFSFISPNIDSRLTFSSDFDRSGFEPVNIDDVLINDTEDTFNKLVNMFLSKNAISGVQPKTLALLENKEAFSTKEYIIKTWGADYPNLAENEWFCMLALKDAGITIPNIFLSENKNFLVVEKFDYIQESDTYLGFEEVIALMGKNSSKKYNGSYEQVAKLIKSLSTNKIKDLKQLYKLITMNYLLKNGDGHLKNFGVLYDKSYNISLSPAYDVVNTTAYIYDDMPALNLDGKKRWASKEQLVKFGVVSCDLNPTEAKRYFGECIAAVEQSIIRIEKYISLNDSFKDIGRRIVASWKSSIIELEG